MQESALIPAPRVISDRKDSVSPLFESLASSHRETDRHLWRGPPKVPNEVFGTLAPQYSLLTVLGNIDGTQLRMLVGTGSSITILRHGKWLQLPPTSYIRVSLPDTAVRALHGNNLDVKAACDISIGIGDFTTTHRVVIIDGIVHECILGLDFLAKHHFLIVLLTNNLRRS